MQKTKEKYILSGQMGGAVGAVIQLITGVGVAVLVLIFVGSLGGQVYNLVESDIDSITTSVIKESKTVLNSTSVSLANDNIVSGSMTVNNGSNSVTLTKFTIDYDLGTVILKDNNFNNTALNFSYTYGDIEVKDSVKGGIISGFEALEQTGNYLPIIVLAVVIALVLFLVLGMGSLNTGGGRGSAL